MRIHSLLFKDLFNTLIIGNLWVQPCLLCPILGMVQIWFNQPLYVVLWVHQQRCSFMYILFSCNILIFFIFQAGMVDAWASILPKGECVHYRKFWEFEKKYFENWTLQPLPLLPFGFLYKKVSGLQKQIFFCSFKSFHDIKEM